VALLRVWEVLLGLYDVGQPRCLFAAASAPAAWQLISSLWQLVSTEVQQIQEPTAPYHAMMMSAMLYALTATRIFLVSWVTACQDVMCETGDPQNLKNRVPLIRVWHTVCGTLCVAHCA